MNVYQGVSSLSSPRCRGMVQSAFEFADICRKHDFHNFLFSMKASNPLVMVAAYRLLAEEMYKKGWDYPLHLGVTGEGQCGGVMCGGGDVAEGDVVE